MAASQGYKARILNGDFSLSAKLSDAEVDLSVEMLDTTTFADNGVKTFTPGLASSTFSCKGFTDAALLTDSAAWTSAQPFAYAPTGLTHGTTGIQILNGLESNYKVGTTVGGAASFDLTGTTDGFVDYAVCLHDLTAETADVTGTTYDSGAAGTSNGGYCQLHVTAFSGFSGAVFIIEGSTNGSSWSTLATFTTVAGTTAERIAITGNVTRYLRCSVDVTGTGSVTYAAFVARH